MTERTAVPQPDAEQATAGSAPAHATRPRPDLGALLGEAMTKSGLLWVDVSDDRAWPVWHVWDDGAALVVSGPGEQPLPWLPPEVRLVLRSKDTGGRLLVVRAHAHVLEPGTPQWARAADLLKASRLNAVDDCLTRWAAACTVTALVPFGEPVESPGSYGSDDHRAAPAATAATTTRWRPWHLGGRGDEKERRQQARAAERQRKAAAKERAKMRRRRRRRGGRRDPA